MKFFHNTNITIERQRQPNAQAKSRNRILGVGNTLLDTEKKKKERNNKYFRALKTLKEKIILLLYININNIINININNIITIIINKKISIVDILIKLDHI